MAKGRFITLEGGEGGGKSTQARLLAEWLGARGIATVVTREPGGTPLAEAVRGLLLGGAGGEHADAMTQALLFSAARRDHVMRLIRPALAAGTWVISDRYADSTRAYQGAGGELDSSIVQRLEEWVTAEAKPDLTLILDLPEAEGLRRANERHAAANVGARDRFETEDPAFHLRLRMMFLRIANAEPQRCALIDAQPAVEVVAEAIRATVSQRLGL